MDLKLHPEFLYILSDPILFADFCQAAASLPVMGEFENFKKITCMDKGIMPYVNKNHELLTWSGCSAVKRDYKSVSVVLSNIEVQLLASLVEFCTEKGMVVLQLEHDGILAATDREIDVDETKTWLDRRLTAESDILYNHRCHVDIELIHKPM